MHSKCEVLIWNVVNKFIKLDLKLHIGGCSVDTI